MQKKLSLLLLFVVLGLGFSIKLWQGMQLADKCIDPEACRGYDIDTYVALTMNESYQPFPDTNAIHRDTEYPVVFLALYPFVFFGGFLGFTVFMALYATLAAALFYILAEYLQPGTGLYAAWLWLFNPLNYRASLDLAQQNLATCFGLMLLVCVILLYEELVDYHNQKLVLVMTLLLALIIYLTHQTGMVWLVMAVLLFAGLYWFAQGVLWLGALLLVLSFVSWRFFIMLAFPVTVALLFAPRKYWPLIATLMFLGYLIAPWIFGAPVT